MGDVADQNTTMNQLRHVCEQLDRIRYAAGVDPDTHVDDLVDAVKAANAELLLWRSGTRRKGFRPVESVPDVIKTAAALARQSWDEEVDHGELMRSAAATMKALSDASCGLLAERDVLRWLHAEAAFERDRLRTALTRTQRENDELQQEVMAHQVSDGYERGHLHGSAAAKRFKDERDAALLMADRLSDQADRAESSRRDWAAEAEYLAHLLGKLVDPDNCRFDHHGGCQAHGFLEPEPGQVCPHELAKWALVDDAVADHLPRPCACISDTQADALGPGFSRPVCAVHPEVQP